MSHPLRYSTSEAKEIGGGLQIKEPQVVPSFGSPLLGRIQKAIRARYYSPRTEKAYLGWIKRFILFHNKRHPAQMGAPEVNQFLSHLAIRGRVSASTQNQALSALLFLYRGVLKRDLDWLDGVVRAKKPLHLPLVLTKDEVSTILNQMRGVTWLMASLLYGAGLRVMECARLRVKDIDFDRREITVRDGKGRKDRVTMLPARITGALAEHLERVRRQHQKDLKRGMGSVELP